MNSILKALVAAACICVIAVSAHYGYTAYQSSVAASLSLAKQQRDSELALEKAKQLAASLAKEAEVERARRKEVRAQKRKDFLDRVEARKASRSTDD
jgi:hypothetical protein